MTHEWQHDRGADVWIKLPRGIALALALAAPFWLGLVLCLFR